MIGNQTIEGVVKENVIELPEHNNSIYLFIGFKIFDSNAKVQKY